MDFKRMKDLFPGAERSERRRMARAYEKQGPPVSSQDVCPECNLLIASAESTIGGYHLGCVPSCST